MGSSRGMVVVREWMDRRKQWWKEMRIIGSDKESLIHQINN